jgi:hypothetical protein
MVILLGMTKFLKAMRKDPELCKVSTKMATDFGILYGKAVSEIAHPDVGFTCVGMDMIPLKGNEWFIESHKDLCAGIHTAKHYNPVIMGPTFERLLEWIPPMVEAGGLGDNKEAFIGGNYVSQLDYKKMIDISKKYNLYLSIGVPDATMVSGPPSAIEEAAKVRCEYGKSHPKCAMGVDAIDYWSPQSYVEMAVEFTRKYGKY